MTPRSSVMTVDNDGEVRTTLVLWFQKPPTQQGRRQQDWQSKLVRLLPLQLLNHLLHGGLMGLQWIYMRDYYHRELLEDIVTNFKNTKLCAFVCTLFSASHPNIDTDAPVQSHINSCGYASVIFCSCCNCCCCVFFVSKIAHHVIFLVHQSCHRIAI